MEALPAEYREFATPALLIADPETADNYLTSTPEFDFSQIYWCKAD